MKHKLVKNRYQPNRIDFLEGEQPEAIARFAFVMIERWGMVQGLPDGEDSTGRAKVGLMPVEDLVDRAFACAQCAWDRAKSLGLIYTIPDADLDEIVNDKKEFVE